MAAERVVEATVMVVMVMAGGERVEVARAVVVRAEVRAWAVMAGGGWLLWA